MKIAIIGGGISGLSTAFYVKQHLPESEVIIFEKEPHLGGTMRTVNKNDFLFEVGSNGFLSNKPDTLNLVKDSGAEALLMRSNDNARIRYIFTDRLYRLPESPIAFIGTKLLSFKGKMRTLGEVFVAPRSGNGDESLRDFGYRRVGKEFTDVFLNAMVAGIFASTPEAISVNAAFPAVVKLEQEYGGLFKGMIKKKKKGAGPGGVLMSFEGGVSTFVEYLATKLQSNIHKNSNISEIKRLERGYSVITKTAEFVVDSVVLCTPAYVSARLLEPIDHHITTQLYAIEYSPISVIGLGYNALQHPLQGFGLLTTASARQQILGILWDSSIFPDRTPPGKKAIRVMIGGQRNPELALKDEDKLIAMAVKGVKTTMGTSQKPDITFVKRWDRGIPNYRLGHLANVDSIFTKLKAFPGLFLNSNAYYGIGLNDCVRNSRQCADQIANYSSSLVA